MFQVCPRGRGPPRRCRACANPRGHDAKMPSPRGAVQRRQGLDEQADDEWSVHGGVARHGGAADRAARIHTKGTPARGGPSESGGPNPGGPRRTPARTSYTCFRHAATFREILHALRARLHAESAKRAVVERPGPTRRWRRHDAPFCGVGARHRWSQTVEPERAWR